MAGALVVIGSMSILGLIDNFVRYIAEYAGLWQFHMTRALIGSTIIICYCCWKKLRIRPKRPGAVAVRSLLLASAILLYSGSLTLMPVAEAGAALFTSPVFMVVIAALAFSTPIGTWRLIAVALGFGGVLLVLKPDVANLNLTTILPLSAGCLYAIGQLCTRHFCSEENTSVVLLGFTFTIGLLGLLGMVLFTVISVPASWKEAAPFFVAGWQTPSPEFLMWTFLQSIGSLIAVAGLIRGYQIAEPTFIAVNEYSFLVFAGFWAWVLWSELPDVYSMLGIALIAGAGILISFRVARLADRR